MKLTCERPPNPRFSITSEKRSQHKAVDFIRLPRKSNHAFVKDPLPCAKPSFLRYGGFFNHDQLGGLNDMVDRA